MKHLFTLVLVMVLVDIVGAQTPMRSYIEDPGLSPVSHPLDFLHLRLELSLDPAKGKVSGKVTHLFKPLRPSVDSFFLNGIKMNVSSLLLNGQAVRYRVDSSGITVYPSRPLSWDTEDSLMIEYSAYPSRGLYFIGWNDPRGLSRKQVWSQGEGIDNRYWIPMYDERNDKLVSELLVSFDRSYQVLSNGHLVDKKENPDGTATWHYLMDHPQAPYLIMLGIGRYAIKETHSGSGLPMHLYYYPDWVDRVSTTYQHSEQMVDFFEKEIGVAYPWESYSQIPVQDYMFGAMENTTATIFGDFYLLDARGILDRTYVSVNAHELAHQWFGDYVTARSESHQWLQESFATYYSQLYERSLWGEDFFAWERRGNAIASIQESQRNKLGVGHSESGGIRMYGKGAFVLHMLKDVVGGREAYNKAIRYYLEKHPYQNVDSHDLLEAFEETTGMDLEWFWDEWIYRGGEPEYQVTLHNRPAETELVVQQTQPQSEVTGYKNGLYKMPFVVEVHYKDGTVDSLRYWVQQQTEFIKIPNPSQKQVGFVLFDPNGEVLKAVSFPKPAPMLLAQAREAASVLDRYDALVGLRRLAVTDKRGFLQDVFKRESFNALRAEALAQLAGDEESLPLMKQALSDPDVQVRKAALSLVDIHSSFAIELLPEIEKRLTDSSYDMVDMTLQKLAVLQPAKLGQYLKKTSAVEGNIGRSVRVRWLELSFMNTHKKNYAEELVTLTSGSYEFRTRGNAMAALKRMDHCSEGLISNLVDAVLSPNSRLSSPGADLLRYFYNQDKWRAVISAHIRTGQWTPSQAGLLAEFTR